MTAQQYLSWLDVGIAALLILMAITLAYLMRLGIAKSLIFASLRTLVQLSTIGFLLVYIFASNHWYLVLLILALMTLIAAITAKKRIEQPYKGLDKDILIAVATPTTLVTALTILLILQIKPWYTPQYIIPILGLILGNSLTAISLCSNQLINALHNEQATIEMMQSVGASNWEASHPLIKNAISNGMMPTINSMMVVGLVSLPGMMTGQILAGADPSQAAKYQIMTMFIICASSALGCMISSWLIVSNFFDNWGCFVPPKPVVKQK